MMNRNEMNAVMGVFYYIDKNVPKDLDVAFDITIVDSNGDTIGRIERFDNEYQFLAPGEHLP